MKLKPHTKPQYEQVTVRLPVDMHEQVQAYSELLGGASDRHYVIVEAVRSFLAADREFQQRWAQRTATPGGGTRARG